MHDPWTWAVTVGLALALSASAGLRAWMPLLLTGVAARMGFVKLSDGFQFLTNTTTLAVFAGATLVEMAADKVPALDHVLDGISTVLRPMTGTLVAASVLWTARDPMLSTVLGLLIGIPASTSVHFAKSGLRATSTLTTAGIANPVLSLIEDILAIALIAFAVIVPVIVAVVFASLGAWGVRRWSTRKTALSEL